jgi:hypothetical protein
MLYTRVSLEEGTPVQFVGVYVLRWGRYDEPTDGFRESTIEEVIEFLKNQDLTLDKLKELW